jgi:hypothetical protein
MKKCIQVVIILILSSCSITESPNEKTLRIMQQSIVSAYEFQDTGIEDYLDFLSSYCGIGIVYFGNALAGDGSKAYYPIINFKKKVSASLYTDIEYICKKYHCTWSVSKGRIAIHQKAPNKSLHGILPGTR